MDWAGLVHAIHSARTSPSAAAWNISTALLPGFEGTADSPPSSPHSAATSARWRGLPRSRWALSRLARPPTSRPPIALGWPVSENGPAPGLPICPVARCRLINAVFLSVPLLLWFKPWQYSDRVGLRCGWLWLWLWLWLALALVSAMPAFIAAPPSAAAPSRPANQRAACTMSSSFSPHTCATCLGVNSRTRSRKASKPLVCAAMKAASVNPSHSIWCSRPWYSATSVPGSKGRCRSATSAVSVRRGSATISFMPGSARRASSRRRNSTGCAQAMFEPVMKTVCARPMSS